MAKGLPSKLTSYICLHFTIPSSPPSHYTYLPSPSCLYLEGGKKNHNTKPLYLAGDLGSGEANDLSLTPSTEEFITFEIKLPSEQMTTRAMLGYYFGLDSPSSLRRIPGPFSLSHSVTVVTSLALCPGWSKPC